MNYNPYLLFSTLPGSFSTAVLDTSITPPSRLANSNNNSIRAAKDGQDSHDEDGDDEDEGGGGGLSPVPPSPAAAPPTDPSPSRSPYPNLGNWTVSGALADISYSLPVCRAFSHCSLLVFNTEFFCMP